jgi:hypothetical protein
MADVTSVVSGTGKAIGRYFSVVSVLPSILLVTYVFLLFSSDSWQHSPNWHAAFAALRNIGLAGAAVLTVSGIVVALVMHPLQFSMVQLLEGYWGPGRLAQQIRISRIHRHRERLQWLDDLTAEADATLLKFKQRDPSLKQEKPSTRAHLKVEAMSQRGEAVRSRDRYPKDPDHAMPTRLGNMLRRYEVTAGASYGLDAPTVLPSLAMIAPPSHLDYLNDQRSAMDLAVRTSMTSAIACLVTLVFLWHSGLWLLIALIPYAAAYAAYRGSVIAAQSYGITMSAVIALNRFALYERMHMKRPPTTARERAMNEDLIYLLNYSEDTKDTSVIYRHPD